MFEVRCFLNEKRERVGEVSSTVTGYTDYTVSVGEEGVSRYSALRRSYTFTGVNTVVMQRSDDHGNSISKDGTAFQF